MAECLYDLVTGLALGWPTVKCLDHVCDLLDVDGFYQVLRREAWRLVSTFNFCQAQAVTYC